MTPLVRLEPVCDLDLGVESFPSYLRRLAGVYGISLHQMLRYLCESTEVSQLVDESPFRAAVSSPKRLGGYSELVGKITRRAQAATGVASLAGTTLQRIGPALSKNNTSLIAKERRYCPRCKQEMAEDEVADWEPLAWGLATLTCCVKHDIPLEIAPSEWHKLGQLADPRLRSYLVTARRGDDGAWCKEESRKLLRFCASDPTNLVREGAPRLFLNTYLQVRHLQIADFCQVTGLPRGNLSRQMTGELSFTLRSVFGVAECLAVSPTDIFEDPVAVAEEVTLLNIPDHGPELSRSHAAHPHHSVDVYRSLKRELLALLQSSDPLPPLTQVCHARGVSTGFARHRMPAEVRDYHRRRRGEMLKQRQELRTRASQVAQEGIKKSSGRLSLKRTERELRAQTGLPKHLLLPALQKAARGEE